MMQRPEEKLVLVVDDEPDVRMVIEAALEDAGFEVVTAANGREAYNRVKERPPDFITLDLVMPQESGALFYLKLCRNKRWRQIPVMVVSAHAHDELGAEDFARLMKGQPAPRPAHFMEKPVQPELLVRTVCEVLGVVPPEGASGAREEVLARLRVADLETLEKIQSVLDEGEG